MLHYRPLNLLVLILFGTTQALAQVKAGESAPDIHITNWIQNTPASKSLQGKFLVIDFWATWCAPCLAAVPHMNDLAEANKKDNRLIFLSLSDERETKIKKLLPKVPFTTAVVTDSTGGTQRRFKISTIPFCVLIDDKLQIQWAGRADQLTNDMLQQFRQRIPIPALPGKLTAENASTKQLYDSLNKEYSKVMDDKDIKEYFSLGPLLEVMNGNRWNRIGPTVFNEAVIGRSIQAELAAKLSVSPKQVLLPPGMAGLYISYCYKSVFRTKPKDLVDNITQQLDLQVTTGDSLQDVIKLEVTDTSRLFADLPELPQGPSRVSNSGNIISLHNNTLKALGDALQGVLDSPVIIPDAETVTKKFNMTVQTGDFEQFRESMRSYGIKVTKTKERLSVYHFQYKSEKDK